MPAAFTEPQLIVPCQWETSMPWTPLVSIGVTPAAADAGPCSIRVPAPIQACPCRTGWSGAGGAAEAGPAPVRISATAPPSAAAADRALVDLLSRRDGARDMATSGHGDGRDP